MSRMIRVESLLKQEISRIIQQDFRSNLGLISITELRSPRTYPMRLFITATWDLSPKKKII